MKEKVKTFFSICILIVAVPYIITLLFQGNKTSSDSFQKKENKQTIQENPVQKDETLDVEKYLLGALAKQIPLDYELEAVKAQAVIARTAVIQAMAVEGGSLPEAMTTDEMIALWGQEGFEDNYRVLESAIQATKGEVLTSQGKHIEAAYHAVSAGKTRSAKEALGREDEPFLSSVDSSLDIPSPDYLKVLFLKKEKLAEKLIKAHSELTVTPEDALSKISILSRDNAGYALQVQVEGITVTGEEFRKILELNSACFYLKEVEGEVRIVTKGLGHGLGLSQYGANEMAKEGKKYQEILKYYYTSIEIISQ